jgi:hypothetical protein
MEVQKIIVFRALKISYFSRLNFKRIMGNYLMPFKEEEEPNYLSP